MEPAAFIPQNALLARIAVKVTKDGKEIKLGTTYDLPDGKIIMLSDLFAAGLDYSHVPDEGMAVPNKVVMEVEIARLLGVAIAAVIKNRGPKGGPLNKLANKSEEPEQLVFRKSVPFRIKQNYHGPFCRPPENCVRILALSNDYLYHIEVALVSQVWQEKIAYAVTVQVSRHGRCYLGENGNVEFFHFNEWPEMLAVIAELCGEKAGELKPRPDTTCAVAAEPVALKPKTAVVKWWSDSLQTGCATTADGQDVKIFAEEMKRPDSCLAFALPGEIISYEKVEGTFSSDTQFKKQLIGCVVVEPDKTVGRTEKFQMPAEINQ